VQRVICHLPNQQCYYATGAGRCNRNKVLKNFVAEKPKVKICGTPENENGIRGGLDKN
jgi:hypothetical protein